MKKSQYSYHTAYKVNGQRQAYKERINSALTHAVLNQMRRRRPMTIRFCRFMTNEKVSNCRT